MCTSIFQIISNFISHNNQTWYFHYYFKYFLILRSPILWNKWWFNNLCFYRLFPNKLMIPMNRPRQSSFKWCSSSFKLVTSKDKTFFQSKSITGTKTYRFYTKFFTCLKDFIKNNFSFFCRSNLQLKTKFPSISCMRNDTFYTSNFTILATKKFYII